MTLSQTFSDLRQSIVAFGTKLAPAAHDGGPPPMPPLIGTGFVVDERGIIATNRHVADALRDMPRHPLTGEFIGFCLVFSAIREEQSGLGLDAHFVEIDSVQALTEFTSSDPFYGAPVPDIAFVQVKVRDLPPVRLATEDWAITVGTEVATAGFPLGTDPLVVHGFVGQGTPLLRRGIVSAVNPFPCPQPHGFTIDVMSQGGASGSPIFRPDDGGVLGILYAGFPGTNITLAVPSLIIGQALEMFLRTHYRDVPGVASLRELASSDQPRTGFSPEQWDAV